MPSGIKLVSSDAQLAKMLRDTGSPCVVVGSEGLASLAHPNAPQPEVLVVDLREEPQFPPALAMLKRHHPSTGVLLVLGKLDPVLMLDAMRAGVNECIAEPLTQPDLQVALKRVLESREPSSRGELFVFIGAKGGVGTTTAAVNVAAALAKLHSDSTLLIDLNIACGDAAVFLGEEPRFSVLDALENVHRLDPTFFRGLVARTKPGLELLGASGRLLTGSVEASKIRALLDFASLTRRYTVLDVPRSDTAALDSLELATKIIIVANQELATVRSAARMAVTLRQRYGQDRLALVLARTDRRAEIGEDDVERTVGIRVSQTLPSDYRAALQAMNKGRPLVLEGQTELARALTGFARHLAGAAEPERDDRRARAASVFGRLAPRRV